MIQIFFFPPSESSRKQVDTWLVMLLINILPRFWAFILKPTSTLILFIYLFLILRYILGGEENLNPKCWKHQEMPPDQIFLYSWPIWSISFFFIPRVNTHWNYSIHQVYYIFLLHKDCWVSDGFGGSGTKGNNIG